MWLRMLLLGLCFVVSGCWLPTCVDETRHAPVVEIAPVIPTVIPVAIKPQPPRPIAPDERCIDEGEENGLRLVSVIAPSFDVASRRFARQDSRLQIVAAQTWQPSPALRVGWIMGRIRVEHPNASLTSFLSTMGVSREHGDAGSDAIALPAWHAKQEVWRSDSIAVLLHRTGVVAALLPHEGSVADLPGIASSRPPDDPSALWLLDEFLSIKLLEQPWLARSFEVADFVLSDYAGSLSFDAYAVELRDADGSLGCAAVFNRRR